MISKTLSNICSGDITTVKNYERAINDNKNMWVLHHFNETNDLKTGLLKREVSANELREKNLYLHRPSDEFIFLPTTVHRRQHNKAKSYTSTDPVFEDLKNKITLKKCIYDDWAFYEADGVRDLSQIIHTNVPVRVVYPNGETRTNEAFDNLFDISLSIQKIYDGVSLEKRFITQEDYMANSILGELDKNIDYIIVDNITNEVKEKPNNLSIFNKKIKELNEGLSMINIAKRGEPVYGVNKKVYSMIDIWRARNEQLIRELNK